MLCDRPKQHEIASTAAVKAHHQKVCLLFGRESKQLGSGATREKQLIDRERRRIGRHRRVQFLLRLIESGVAIRGKVHDHLGYLRRQFDDVRDSKGSFGGYCQRHRIPQRPRRCQGEIRRTDDAPQSDRLRRRPLRQRRHGENGARRCSQDTLGNGAE